jgi:GNAT superfamily N-acetyltransferase
MAHPSHQHQPNDLGIATLSDPRLLTRIGILTLRPIQPQDGDRLATLLNGLAPASRRNRFHGAAIPGAAQVQAMTQPDPRRQPAWVVSAHMDGTEQLIADARYCVADDGLAAEFALVVGEPWQRLGVGAWAMHSLQRMATAAGLQWLEGDVLRSNLPMLGLMQRCGFALCPDPEDDQIVKVQRRLGFAPVRSLPRARSGLRAWLQQAWPAVATAASAVAR